MLEHSIGCVGILNTWLIRAFRNALLEDAKTLTMKHLQQAAYSAARRQQLQEEAEAGERRLQESKSSIVISSVLPTDKPRSVRPGRVGKRNPKRDPVGVTSNVN